MMDKFAQSLATVDETQDKNIYFEFHDEKTSCMFKKAYVTSMKKPTIENIKEYITGRVKSDLGVKDAEVRVVIDAENSDGENVSKGKGAATIKLNNKTIAIPFNIVDGEISDFNEIKIGNESIAYNKQSLSKIVQDSNSKASESDAFIGTSRTDNESTDRGFLEEVIKIRDNHMNRQVNSSSGGRYITASEACNEMLQKSASIKKFDEITYNAIEAMVREKIASSVEEKLEKIASIDIDKKINHAQEVFAKMEQLPLKSVHSMKHGQTILFPEINGNEVSMTPGIVFKKIDKDYYKSTEILSATVSSSYTTIVVSYDGRIALLSSGQTMLALEDDTIKFKLPLTRLKAIMPNQTYFAVVGDSVIAPFYIQDRWETRYEGTNKVIKELSEVLGVYDPVITVKPSFVYETSWLPSMNIVLIPGETFKSNLKKVKVGGNTRYINGASAKLKKILSHKPNLLASVSSVLNLDSTVTADPDTKVVKVKGIIKGYISNKNELNPNKNNSSDHIKLANYDTLRIEKVARDKEQYSVKVNGKNKKDFGNKLNKKEVQTIMLSMGYKPDDIGEAMHSVKSSGKYHKQLPTSTDINKLYGGEVNSKTNQIMNKVKDSLFDKERAKEAAKTFGINMTAGTLGDIASENEMIYSALEYLSKFAKESEAAAITFEKLAMEYKSEELQNVAKVMVTANNLFSTVNNAYKGEKFNLFKEACESIVMNKAALEEIVTGISGLSKDQFLQSNEYVPYEALRTATEVIGGMFELAKQASVNNQDIMCIECGAKAEKPLQNGKCEKCVNEEIAELNDEEKKEKTTDNEEKKDNAEEDDE